MDKVVRMEVKRLEEETILIRLLLKINFSIESIANCYAQNKKKLKICPKMCYRKLKILDQTDQTDQTDQIEYERVGARTVKHAKLSISSFDE